MELEIELNNKRLLEIAASFENYFGQREIELIDGALEIYRSLY